MPNRRIDRPALRPAGHLSAVALAKAERGPAAGPAPGGAPDARVALAYPNANCVGMSSLGFQIAHQILRAAPGVRVERFFHDTMKQGSIETRVPLAAFDAIAFSAAYELDAPHVLDILETAGVPLLAHRRAPDRSWPLVAMGGVLVSLNRLPLEPFVDVFCHGEAEVILPALAERLVEA